MLQEVGLVDDAIDLLHQLLQAPGDSVDSLSGEPLWDTAASIPQGRDRRMAMHQLSSLRCSVRDAVADVAEPHADATLRQLPPAPARTHTLGPLRVIRVPRGSTVEAGLRAGRYLDRVSLDRLARQVARADGWPDATTERDPLAEAARAWSNAFGRRYAYEPQLPDGMLADAVYRAVYNEASHRRPMLRVADELASAGTDTPVILEVPSPTVSYLVGASVTSFSMIYLYFALIERGVNAFLCCYTTGHLTDIPLTVSFAPRWDAALRRTTMATRQVGPASDSGDRVALVPAGIRSFSKLRARYPAGAVYESGTVVGEFAYDRRHPKMDPVAATTPLHPRESVLPTFLFVMQRTAAIRGHDLVESPSAPLDAALEESEPVGGDWMEWLYRATSPFLSHLAREAAADIVREPVREVHVSDYLLPESAIVGETVRRSGGRVVLHPHSSNPVHVLQRREESFDEVEAATRTGVAMWRERFPGKRVRHVPDLVVSPRPGRPFIPGEPLSVVIFGGVPTIGRSPWIDLDRHAQSYRDLFDGLADLQRDGAGPQVYFKPRGVVGDNEHWLQQTVGRTANWRSTHVHAHRLDLPSQLFVSVSMGTTALIEGIAVGTPGLVVRDFPVRDYTTLRDDNFPILDVARSIELIGKLADEAAYVEFRRSEQAWAHDEIDLPCPGGVGRSNTRQT